MIDGMVGAIRAARAQGRAVPEDLSVVGFDDIPMASWSAYRLTTVAQHVDAMVAAAIETPWSNGQTEGQICRLKTLKRQMGGRANVDLLKARMLPAA